LRGRKRFKQGITEEQGRWSGLPCGAKKPELRLFHLQRSGSKENMGGAYKITIPSFPSAFIGNPVWSIQCVMDSRLRGNDGSWIQILILQVSEGERLRETHGNQKTPLLLALDTVFAHLGIEGAAGDAQFFGGQGQIAADAFEGAANKGGLGLGESA
jgi:hypothetical protein